MVRRRNHGWLWFNLVTAAGAVVAAGIAVAILLGQVSTAKSCTVVTGEVTTHEVIVKSAHWLTLRVLNTGNPVCR